MSPKAKESFPNSHIIHVIYTFYMSSSTTIRSAPDTIHHCIMAVASIIDQLFVGNNSQPASGSFSWMDSPSMLLSVMSEEISEFYHKSTRQLEEQWQYFLQSSWAKHWLPEIRYLQGWALIDIILLVFIGLLTASWYTIRNERKTREAHRKQEKAHSENNLKNVSQSKDKSYRHSSFLYQNWLRYRNLPTLDVSALGFSTGTSWERRYQTLAMFSCSLYIVMPGTIICWFLVIHFGAFLPLHVFVWNDFSQEHAGEDFYVPRFYELRTIVTALLVWVYMFYTFLIDSSQTAGTRKPLMREWFPNWWNHACDYLPVVLVKTADLPAYTTIVTTTDEPGHGGEPKIIQTPNRYVMGYHPHGIIAVGAFCAFATDGARVLDLSDTDANSDRSAIFKRNARRNSARSNRLRYQTSSLSLSDDDSDASDETLLPPASTTSPPRGFSSLFPNVDRRIVTLPVNFGTPFLRDYLLSMGAVTSEKETFRRYLNKNHSNSRAMVVVVGGAAESMYAYEGHTDLVLKHRRGFVREAILANASLVPVLGFGETNLYRLYDEIDVGDREAKDLKAMYVTQSLSLASSLFSGCQKFARKAFGVAVPLFTGRSIFFKSLGIMPRRRPVVVVVGKPIPPPDLGASIFLPQIDRATDRPLNEHGKILIEWHAKYVQALEDLFDEYKDAPWNSPGKLRQESMKIVR